MKNNFEIFIENVEKLKLESNRTACYTLIELARYYYSLDCQYRNLERVRHKLANIYELCDRKIKIKDKQIDIRYRLFLDFYFTFACASAYPKNNYILVSKNRRAILDDLEEEYKLSQYNIRNNNVYGWIDKSCKKATEIYKENQRFELGLDNIKKAVRLYIRYEQIKQKTEEESFNGVFSNRYVDILIDVMKANEGLLLFFIAPVRMLLCKKEQGGKEINSKAWKWCFEKDFRLTTSELEDRIKKLKQYSKILHQFDDMDKALNKIAKEII